MGCRGVIDRPGHLNGSAIDASNRRGIELHEHHVAKGVVGGGLKLAIGQRARGLPVEIVIGERRVTAWPETL